MRSGRRKEVAPTLLTHLNHPQFSSFALDPEARLPPFQVWLPNNAHLEMLDHLAYAYTFTRFGRRERWMRLRWLGHACSWLFREAHPRTDDRHAVGLPDLSGAGHGQNLSFWRSIQVQDRVVTL